MRCDGINRNGQSQNQKNGRNHHRLHFWILCAGRIHKGPNEEGNEDNNGNEVDGANRPFQPFSTLGRILTVHFVSFKNNVDKNGPLLTGFNIQENFV